MSVSGQRRVGVIRRHVTSDDIISSPNRRPEPTHRSRTPVQLSSPSRYVCPLHPCHPPDHSRRPSARSCHRGRPQPPPSTTRHDTKLRHSPAVFRGLAASTDILGCNTSLVEHPCHTSPALSCVSSVRQPAPWEFSANCFGTLTDVHFTVTTFPTLLGFECSPHHRPHHRQALQRPRAFSSSTTIVKSIGYCS